MIYTVQRVAYGLYAALLSRPRYKKNTHRKDRKHGGWIFLDRRSDMLQFIGFMEE